MKRKISKKGSGNPNWGGSNNPNWRGGPVSIICDNCGKIGYYSHSHVIKHKHHFCSRKCRDEWRIGKSSPKIQGAKNPRWKGGKYIKGGYPCIYCPNHPRAIDNHVFEHILIMEKSIGRYLKPEEVVHHKNEIKTDNRIENLALCKNHSEHITKFHCGSKSYLKTKSKATRERMSIAAVNRHQHNKEG